MNVMMVVISKYYSIVRRIRQLLAVGILFTAFQSTLFSQGASLPVYNGKDESINLIVYNSPINCKKNFAVQLNLKQGLRNGDDLVQWKMDYTGCDGKRHTADMSTPIGIRATNANNILSFASSYSNELNLEHAFISPWSELSNVQSIIGVRDVIIVSEKSHTAQTLISNDSLIVYIEHLKKTIGNNPFCGECYTELASLLIKIKRYDEAANYYQLKIDKIASPTPLDYYYLGQSLYYNKEYQLADSAFAIAAAKYPDANFWRGRCNNRMELNPDQPVAGLAKPYHEKFIRLVGSEPRAIEANKKNLIESHNYLAIYYLIHKDYGCSRAAVNKVLEFDPTNKIANTLAADENVMKTRRACVLVPENE